MDKCITIYIVMSSFTGNHATVVDAVVDVEAASVVTTSGVSVDLSDVTASAVDTLGSTVVAALPVDPVPWAVDTVEVVLAVVGLYVVVVVLQPGSAMAIIQHIERVLIISNGKPIGG